MTMSSPNSQGSTCIFGADIYTNLNRANASIFKIILLQMLRSLGISNLIHIVSVCNMKLHISKFQLMKLCCDGQSMNDKISGLLVRMDKNEAFHLVSYCFIVQTIHQRISRINNPLIIMPNNYPSL